MKRTLAFLLLAFLLAGCAVSTTAPTLTPVPSVVPSPISIEKPELGEYFKGVAGAFVLLDRATSQTIRYNPSGCAEGLLPASTFKILNALIALETGVIPDENYVIQWDGRKWPVETWNRDHTLQSAMQNSVVWYYQEVARRIGSERMQKYVDAAGYGNRDISGNLDSFWLDGGLRISADEQVAFLRRLYENNLPFSARSMQIVRKMIIQEEGPGYKLSGKTGTTQMNGKNIAWYIGYVETKDDVNFFAANLQGANEAVQAAKAREIALHVLRGLKVLP